MLAAGYVIKANKSVFDHWHLDGQLIEKFCFNKSLFFYYRQSHNNNKELLHFFTLEICGNKRFNKNKTQYLGKK